MTIFELYVQEGCVADESRPVLESALRDVCADVLGPDALPVEFDWTVIRKGHGFRGGKPSTTSLVRSRIPDGCDSATRGQFLASIGRQWCRIAGATEHEVVASARDWSWKG